MVASPQPIDLQAQINALNRKVNNLINSPRPVNTVPVGQPIVAANGTVLVQADPAGGLAYPWYSVPILDGFTGPTGPNSTTTYPNGAFVAPSQLNTSVPGAVNGNNWFAAYLPYVSHPRLIIKDFTGFSSPVTSTTWAITLYSNNFGTILAGANWTNSTAGGVFESHTFDISAYLGRSDIGIGIWLMAITGSDGFAYFQPYGMFLRGSV